MDVIEFELVVASINAKGSLLIALMDGAQSTPQPHKCVGLLLCRPETARALCAAVGSALKAAE